MAVHSQAPGSGRGKKTSHVVYNRWHVTGAKSGSSREGVLMLSRVCVPALILAHLAFQPSVNSSPTSGLITVGEDRPLDIGATGLATVEPYLAADPQNPGHLVAGVSVVEALGDPRRTPPTATRLTCVTLASFDGGRTWQRHDFRVQQCFDPWTVVLPDGSAVFQGLGNANELVAFRSADGGKTWSDTPVAFGRGFDLTAFTMNPVVLSSGVLAVPFANFAHAVAGGGLSVFDRAPNWLVVSGDGGRTFSAPRFITDICARGFPELAVGGPEGPYRDRLYWVCHDREFEHIYLLHSADLGETWSTPIVVNGTPGSDPYVRNVVVAVNQDGIVAVSWYDARNDPRGYRGTFRCQELFFAASLDGGQTFLPGVKVSTEENCPDTPANGEAGRRWVAGGDYHGLAATADGQFHVMWPDTRTGIYQLRTATIRVDSKRSP
jgi:hypothetical protein